MSNAHFAIRHINASDWEALHKILSGPKVIWGTLQLPFPSADAWKKRLSEPPDGFYSLVACHGDERGEVVGHIGLQTFPNRPRRHHVGAIGMMVRDDWQGKGVGTALMQSIIELADNWLNLTRLELEVYTDNEFAIRLYQKFGFGIEGTSKQQTFREGTYVDSHQMARLRTRLM
ncbi:MAG: GNAT family N-acetyltransferase [Deinococcaceae bacterium]